MVMLVPYGRNGQTAPVSPQVNCPSYLLPGRDRWPLLKEALAEITPEEVEDGYVVTIEDLSDFTPLTVIENTNRDRVFWAVYMATKPQRLSLRLSSTRWKSGRRRTLSLLTSSRASLYRSFQV